MYNSEEIYITIDGYNGKYAISNLGNIKSISRLRRLGKVTIAVPDKILVQCVSRNGYSRVCLHGDDGKQHNRSIHRLVALAFVKNPYNYPQVNHINGNKQDNRAENLEWVTGQMNVRHSFDKLNRKGPSYRRAKMVKCVNSGKVYRSMADAAKDLGVSEPSIRNWCINKHISKTGIKLSFV